MGLRDWISGGSASDGDDKDDGRINDKEWVHGHYEVKRSAPESNGGWTTVSVAGQEEWGYPISEREFRANMPNPDPGKYRLWSVDKNGIHHPPRDQDVDWVMQVEDDGLGRETGGTDPQISQLEQKVDALTARLEDGGGKPNNPEQMLEYARAQVAMGALNSKEFLDRFGAQIAMSVLGADDKNGDDIGFDEWQDSPLGATIYQSINDPQKVEDLGEAFGSASSNFMSGFMDEFGQGDGGRALETDREQDTQEAPSEPNADANPDREAEPDPTAEPSSAEAVDGGPSSLDDLAENIPADAAPDMEEVTREFAETNMAMQDQRDHEEEEPEMPDPEQMSNGDTEDQGVDLHTEPDSDPEPAPDPDPTESFAADDPDDVSDAQTGDTEDADDAGDEPLDPQTPSELRDLEWNELQQVASRNGLNPTQFGGAEGLRTELEKRLFGTADEESIEDAAEELSGSADDTPQTESGGENPSPDAVAEGL